MPRPRCPFYGFHWPEGTSKLTDSGANECALDFEHNEPCWMEREGKVPDFDRCAVADRVRMLLEPGKHLIHFFPAELAPEGVNYDRWRDLVMKRS